MSNLNLPFHNVNPSHQELKFLVMNRSRTTEKLSQLKVQFIRLLEILFPELATIVGKANLHSKYIYDMFKVYPSPKKLAKAETNHFFKF